MTSPPLTPAIPAAVPKGRLAPSPTGAMHLGNARTALLAWLSAKSRGGAIVLRIEDLDTPRVVSGTAAGIIEDFRRLGLTWDEGPVGDTPDPLHWQSQRHALYRQARDSLLDSERCFPCACSRADIARAASAPHLAEEGQSYPGTCRMVPPDQVSARARARAKQTAFRYLGGESVSFEDTVCGPHTSRVDDFVLWRADGLASYQLAVVVDDGLMGVTEVVRGDDLLASTPRQLALHHALGFTPPRYAHVPLVLAPDGARLAKRNRPAPLASFFARGIEPEALVGALAASAGLCPPGQRLRPKDLLGRFSWDRVARHPVVIDPETLEAHPARLPAGGPSTAEVFGVKTPPVP